MKALLKPFRLQFTAPADVEKYGDGWYVWDEAVVLALPARELIVIEREIVIDLRLRLVDAIQSCRNDGVAGELACSWIAVRLADPNLAGALADYNPAVKAIEWEQIPDDQAVPAEVPLDPTPETDSTSTAAPE